MRSLEPANHRSAPARESWRRHARRTGTIVLPWLTLAVLYTPAAVYSERDAPNPDGWGHILVHYLAIFLLWALYTPLIAALLRRQPLTWPPKLRAIAIHLSCAAVLVAAHAALMAVYDVVVASPRVAPGYTHNLLQNLVYRGAFGFVLYTATAACLAAWDALRRYHLRERSIVQAQLDALVAQLEPHFLFNTINAVSELVYRDPVAADRVLTQLGGLLRRLLDRRDHEHSLRDELAMLREYTSIQSTLLGDRLKLHWEVPDGVLDARVPTLLLQPIVENAIRHGVAQLRRGGSVTVSARVHGRRLQLGVRNDGPPPQHAREGGLGLANTRARLHALYGTEHELALEALATGGCEVRIELPWRDAGKEPGAGP